MTEKMCGEDNDSATSPAKKYLNDQDILP